LILLRNLYEHWDEQRPAFQDPSVPKHKSGKRLAELCPDARPWSITYAPGEWLLGGVLRLSELTAALMRLEEAALQLETTYLAEKRRSRTTRS
jgi:hypothetical protein